MEVNYGVWKKKTKEEIKWQGNQREIQMDDQEKS